MKLKTNLFDIAEHLNTPEEIRGFCKRMKTIGLLGGMSWESTAALKGGDKTMANIGSKTNYRECINSAKCRMRR
ncbi:MAG: hypothetical protein ABR534_16700, partial [Desulfotignum sp.]